MESIQYSRRPPTSPGSFSELSSNPSSEGPVVRGQWSVVLPLAAFSLLWLDLIHQLSYVWSTNEQYAYGWFVPIFALGLFIKKWPSRPLAAPDRREGGSDFSVSASGYSDVSISAFQRFSFSSSAFIFLLCLLLLPLRVIHEINQDWPLISWPYTLIVVALTLYAIHLAAPPSSVICPPSSGLVVPGPRSLVSPWLLHFAFPICFILVAVQWPWRIENALTQGLMRLDANITVEILGWLNIPAMQRGNLIELSTGTVGVNEACSGIRSFQSTLMAALVLGELYLLRCRTRLLLVASGLALAFGLNVVRTLILSYQANAHGLSAIDKWHDPAGFTIAIACFLVLWAVAVLITKRWPNTEILKHRNTETPSSALRPLTSGITDLQPSAFSLQPSPEGPLVSSLSSVLRPPSPVLWRRFALAIGLWSLLCILATEAWYRDHDAKAPGFVRWSATLPETKPTFEKIELPPRTLKLLKYDAGSAGEWHEADGSDWTVYFFEWHGKSMQSILSARYHRPEVCLPASGLQEVADSQTDYFETASLKLPFKKSSYAAPGKMLFVFFCLWQDGDERRKGVRSSGPADRLLGPLEGSRRFGQQTLEIKIGRAHV